MDSDLRGCQSRRRRPRPHRVGSRLGVHRAERQGPPDRRHPPARRPRVLPRDGRVGRAGHPHPAPRSAARPARGGHRPRGGPRLDPGGTPGHARGPHRAARRLHREPPRRAGQPPVGRWTAAPEPARPAQVGEPRGPRSGGPGRCPDRCLPGRGPLHARRRPPGRPQGAVESRGRGLGRLPRPARRQGARRQAAGRPRRRDRRAARGPRRRRSRRPSGDHRGNRRHESPVLGLRRRRLVGRRGPRDPARCRGRPLRRIARLQRANLSRRGRPAHDVWRQPSRPGRGRRPRAPDHGHLPAGRRADRLAHGDDRRALGRHRGHPPRAEHPLRRRRARHRLGPPTRSWPRASATS